MNTSLDRKVFRYVLFYTSFFLSKVVSLRNSILIEMRGVSSFLYRRVIYSLLLRADTRDSGVEKRTLHSFFYVKGVW